MYDQEPTTTTNETVRKTYNINMSQLFSILYPLEDQDPEKAKNVKIMAALFNIGGFTVDLEASKIFDILEQGNISPGMIKLLRMVFEDKKDGSEKLVLSLDAVNSSEKNEPQDNKQLSYSGKQDEHAACSS